MRNKYFYSHLMETSILSVELGEMDLTPKERVHLISLIESNIHHEILDLILSELGPADKKTFLTHLASEDHEKVWRFLNQKVDKIEDKIKKTAEALKRELHRDIKEVRAVNDE